MNNFVPLLRSDRLREIMEYNKRGYVFRLGEDRFKYVRNISVYNLNNQKYDFEVRVSQDEPRFYIVSENNNIKENCIYLTIYEIYLILVEMAKKLSIDEVTRILKSKRSSKISIEYTGLKFQLNFFSYGLLMGGVKIPESNIEITYENFLILLALIQDKSNYYWSISNYENKKNYTDGILRLLITLINIEGSEILESHKWYYNKDKKIYEQPKEKYEFKYYLTEEEFNSIMEVKS